MTIAYSVVGNNYNNAENILSGTLNKRTRRKFVIKLLRAQGGCLGDKRRRRT